MLFTLLAFAVALGLLITFHELGHYWVARRCGVRVLRFSIGFGRVLMRRTDRHGTEWALSTIPLGGYVKMQDEPPANATAREVSESFDHKPLWQRMAIVLAGPVANFILAAILYAGLNVLGTHEPAAVIAPPGSSTPAAQAGLQGGERITAVNSHAIRSWNQVRWQMLDGMTSGGHVELQAQDGTGTTRDYVMQLSPQSLGSEETDPLANIGLTLAAARPIVLQIVDGGAGQLAGLQIGDIIIRAGTLIAPTAQALIEQITAHPGQALILGVLRNDTELTMTVVPQMETGTHGEPVARIGVMLGADFQTTLIRYGVLESVYRGIERTASTAWFSLKMMGRMVTGDVSVRNISGPVTIADYAGQTARAGLVSYIGFLALISVSIGVLNLLPIPLLDGGHLMFYAIEAVRGSPLPEKWMEHGHRLGLALLAALMGLAFFNDFARLFT